MIDRVYLIGAGASVPYGLPTLKTLTWDLSQSMSPEDRTTFSTAVYECFGTALRKNGAIPDFEELLNRLDPRALLYLEDVGLGGPDSFRRKAAELALSGLRTFIRDACARVSENEGPFDFLVRSLSEKNLLVSFNWDVLLECALLRAGRKFAYLPSGHAEDAVVLLKPHGSINWFALLDREMLMVAGDSNLDVVGHDLSNYMLYVKEPLSPISFGSSSPIVQHVLSRVPAIVPPMASKLLSVGGVPRDGFVEAGHARTMKATWRHFIEALEQASELVAIGYSLPGTDAASIEALKRFGASANAQRPKRVLLVEPQDAVAERYRSLLGVDTKIVCRDFRKFDPGQV